MTSALAVCVQVLLLCAPQPGNAAVEAEVFRRAAEVEAYLPGHPKRALVEIPPLLASQDVAASTRRQLIAMQGQALVLAGRIAEAHAFADRLEAEARVGPDPLGLATALLVRSALQSSIGDARTANAFARQANALVQGTEDRFLRHWALLAIGTTARAWGRAMKREQPA
jgi:hypothetical protein